MVEEIIIYGSGGMAREVVELIEDINRIRPTWSISGYLDDIKGDCSEVVNGYKVIGTGEVLKSLEHPANVVLAISNPEVKERIYNNIKGYPLRFPVLVHPSARVARSARIGEGSIIGIDCIVSVNVDIGRHVFLNMRTVVGHDAVIRDYCSCLVNCIIAGDVTMDERTLLGSGCIIMEKIHIGKKARVGMGSIVSCDVQDSHVVMSRPSKSMYFGE
ncbi:MAG: hypothetical protein FIA99_05255 [Ruminiclostridium sp.]|nr:hypothetical protein [Ruminiclostridium sp.]